jgi:hypothetical protein
MSEKIQLLLESLSIEEIEELKNLASKNSKNIIPSYSFSKIKFKDIENLVEIEEKLHKNRFDFWFNSEIKISQNTKIFLQKLIDENSSLIDKYDEEDLKLYFLAPIFHHINFKSFEKEFRAFYNEKINYKTDKFILNGEVDFVLSLGLLKSKKPYFFIQEFKKGIEFSDPRPQLIAELIAGLEISKFEEIKGAFIIGSIWNFVILEKLGENKYQYFVSENFDSSKIGDLKAIYKNLLFIKNEIINNL